MKGFLKEFLTNCNVCTDESVEIKKQEKKKPVSTKQKLKVVMQSFWFKTEKPNRY